MARNGLAEKLGMGSEWPSISIVEAPGVTSAELAKELDRRLEERVRAESGPVRTYYAPDAFEWVSPDYLRADETSIIRVEAKEIAVSIGRDDEEAMALLGQRVEVGFTKVAIAIRLAQGKGYKLTKVFAAGRRGAVRAAKVVREAHRRGFVPKTVLEARWDPRSKMLVGVRPAEKAQGRRAG